MKKKFKSLDEHNSASHSWHMADFILPRNMADWNKPQPNGIACPKCGEELMDSKPSETLASNPPQKNIHCSSCDYRGYRIA